MNDLISRGHQLTEAVARRGRDREITTLEKVPDSVVARIEAIERALEDRPVALQPVNDQQVIPRAIGDLTVMVEGFQGSLSDVVSRIDRLEKSPPTEPAELQEEIDKINAKVADISKAMLSDLLEFDKRLVAVDAQLNNMPRKLLQFYEEEMKRLA